jgi:two-component system phosphate regulon sensor histidine kinase PhoR
MWRVLVMFAALLVLGLVIGAVAWCLLLGLLIYLGWHLYNLYLLQRWLVEGKRFHPPESNGVWDDVFERIYRLQKRNRKRKRNLGRMLKRFQTATAALPDATIVLGPNRDIEWWNASARDILELRSPRDIGQRIDNLLRHPRFIEYLQQGDFSQSVVIPSPTDYNVSLAVRVVPYGGNRQLVVARDITRLERLEQARRDFVANVSHELRSPLTVISGYLETLLEEQGEDPVWGKYLRSMSGQTERMRDIVDDLLLLSRLETGRQHDDPEAVDVPGMLAQILEEAARISGDRGHRFGREVEARLGLRGNELELRSAFSNLVFNAVNYTPVGGAITVRWQDTEAGPRFEVVDSGIGIAAHHIPRLTERFYRVDAGRSRRSGGTGLGLAIVKHVLLRHDAALAIESAPGKGSQFRCQFPAGRKIDLPEGNGLKPR